MDELSLLLVACPDPECGNLAEVVDLFDLSSTDGDITHAKTWCLRNHGFTVPAERLIRLTLRPGVPGEYRVPG